MEEVSKGEARSDTDKLVISAETETVMESNGLRRQEENRTAGMLWLRENRAGRLELSCPRG